MTEVYDEKILDKYPSPITIESSKKIIKQLEKSICKIKNKKGKGTGFFCYIKDKDKDIPVMITNNHVIDEKIIRESNKIRVTINDDKKSIDIKLDNNKKIYSSPKDKYDVTIIELIEEEKNIIKDFIEIDDNIFDDNINIDNENIYILQYPKYLDKQIAAVSYGILKEIEIGKEYNIIHLCSTESGSSGSPILKTSNNKIIGIHKESSKKNDYNIGTLIKYPINEFINNINLINKSDYIYKKNEIIINLKAEKEDINKEIYFLDNTNGNLFINGNIVEFYHDNLKELNESNVELYINNKRVNYRKYFSPFKDGIYTIKLKFNILLKDCSFMFYNCKNIKSLNLSSFDIKNVIKMDHMFFGCCNLTDLNLSYFNTEKVIDMNHMFCNCKKITNLNLSSFITKNVINMSGMFKNCENINDLNLSFFDTRNVIDMSYMFCNCKNITNLNLTSFITKNVNNMCHMFSDCENVTNLNLNSFITIKVKNMSNMFSYCINITELNLSSFDINNANDLSYMFNYCLKLKSVTIKKDINQLIKEQISNDCKNTKIIEVKNFNPNY